MDSESRVPDGDDDGGVTLSLQDVPALSTEVRLRVLAGALDPDAPAASPDLVPSDGPGDGSDPAEPIAFLAAAPDDDLHGYGDHVPFSDQVPFGDHTAPDMAPDVAPDQHDHHADPDDDAW
jgi:hypothetical protein